MATAALKAKWNGRRRAAGVFVVAWAAGTVSSCGGDSKETSGPHPLDAGRDSPHDAAGDDSNAAEAASRDAGEDAKTSPVDAAKAGCSDGAEAFCRGDTIVSCFDVYEPIDCSTYWLYTLHPLVAKCAVVANRSTCAAPIGETCSTVKDGHAYTAPCLGESPGCVIHPDGASECVEHLGQCDDPARSDRCVGPYRFFICLGGQPEVFDCTDFWPGATCGSSAGVNYCENIGEGGRCSANADGSSDVGDGTARCAPGLRCFGALGPARADMGVCQAPPLDPCTTASKTSCDGNVVRTCVGGVPGSVDCSQYLTAEWSLRAICSPIGGTATCASFGRCKFGDDNTETVGCIGVESACVIHGGASECRENVGTCQGTGPTTPACFGTLRTISCRQGQPVVTDCADFGPHGSDCGFDATSNWCENIEELGMCDSNADGSTNVGAREFRCAKGLTCAGAGVLDGGVQYGQCRS
jgi:hypothetical protein